MENMSKDAVGYDGTATVPLAYHEVCVTRYHETIKRLIKFWAISIVLVVGLFVFLWLQYDYVSTTEYTGVYNLVDSEGNVVTSDITPDDVIRILEELNRGDGSKDAKPEA